MSLIKELQRRNVFRVAAAYLAVAWLLIEVGATLEPAMHLPDWVDSVLAFFLLLGFPIALFMSWAYELTPEGLKRESEVDIEASVRALQARKWDRLIIVVLVMAVAYFAFDKYMLQGSNQPVAPAEVGEVAGTPPVTATDVNQPLAPATVPAKSIAVLPFVNMSSDPEQEYFSDGLTEELLNLLAGIQELKVAARTSSFYYKDKVNQVPLPEIARQLEVAHVLEGSVRKSGDQIRITAQLIKADDGYHLWSQTYDRTLDDVFAIQDEISAAVVDALKVTLLGEAPKAAVIDTESWELTQQARYLYNRRAPGDPEQALELYERAVELDPDNATAWVGLAPLYVYLFDPPRTEDGVNAIERALEIDPDHPEALIRMSGFLYFQGKPAEARAAERRALEAGPDNPLVLGIMAGREINAGNLERGLELQRRALTNDPLHMVNLGNMAGYLVEAGRFDEAERWALKERSLASGKSDNAGTLATIKLFQGDYQAVQQYLDEMESGEGTPLNVYIPGEKTMLMAMLEHSRGDKTAALSAMKAYREEHGEDFPIGMAYIHAWRGETELAWEWLDRSLERYPTQNWRQFANHVFLQSLRHDPRWDDLMAHFDRVMAQRGF